MLVVAAVLDEQESQQLDAAAMGNVRYRPWLMTEGSDPSLKMPEAGMKKTHQ